MTREDVVKQLKEKADIEIGSLKKSVMDLIFDFGGGDPISSEMTVETSDVIDDGELIGTEVIESIFVRALNYLYSLEIIRNRYVSDEDPEIFNVDNFVDIKLYWNDNSDSLTYRADYYPNMSNESVVEDVKALIKAAELIMKNAWNK